MADRLPSELLGVIGCKLDTAGDRVRFRAVSKSWRSALPFRQPPWLLLTIFNEWEPIEFVVAGEQTVCNMGSLLPKIFLREVMGCAGSWLIISTSVCLKLLNPFSRLEFKLPPRFRVDDPNGFPAAKKVVFFSVSRFSGDHQNAAAVLWNSSGINKLSVLRPGDASWISLADYPNMENNYFEDIIFYKGLFYAISTSGKLFAWDIWEDASRPPELSFVTDCIVDEIPGPRKQYLVKWSGELLRVVRFFSDNYYGDGDDIDYNTSTFRTHKFDFANMKFDVLKCLGDHSLFLGNVTSMSVPASDYLGLVRRNCIYFANDIVSVHFMEGEQYVERETEDDVGIFDFEDNSITPHFKGTFTSSPRGAVWIIPA